MDGFDRMFGQAQKPPGTESGIGNGGDDPAGGRGRDSLLLIATMRLGDDPTTDDVRIRNLSAGGMMVEYAGHVAIGTVAMLDLRGIGPVRGHVAWCTQGRLGIALDRPIDPMRARKPVNTGTKTPAYAKSIIEITRKRP